tara:strand:- start:2054 stop:3481 length:1428 start_codon:yes stop_codon:yes gene_type:complete
MWDAYQFDYAFLKGDLNGLNLWAVENSHRCYLFLINSLFSIKNISNLENEILFDVFNIGSFIFYISQITKTGSILLKIEKRWFPILLISSLILPIWEGFTSLVLGFYLFYFGMCLMGFRLFFYSQSWLKIILGFFLLLNSLCVQSNYSIIIGLILCYLVTSKINRDLIFKSLILTIFVFATFLINYFYFPAYGFFENYNKILIDNVTLTKLSSNFFNFLTFFLFFSWILLILFFLKFKNKTKFYFERNNNFNVVVILFVFAVLPYISINKSTDIFAWKDYLSRHAYLLTISFSFFFTLILKNIYELDKSIGKKIFFVSIYLFLFQGLLLQFSKFYFKIEASVFRESLVQNLREFDEPNSGLVEFYRHDNKKFNVIDKHDYLPGHRVRNQEISVLFYKAYGKSAWLFFIPKSKNFKKLDFNKYKTLFNADDFDLKSKCVTKIYFSERLSYFERIKFLYIFNSNKYYKINKLKTICS